MNKKNSYKNSDIEVICENCGKKQKMRYACVNCNEVLLNEKNKSLPMFMNLASSAISQDDILKDYKYIDINERFERNYFDEDKSDREFKIFNKNIKITYVSKQIGLVYKLFTDALDNWYKEAHLTGSKEDINTTTKQIICADNLIREYLKFFAEYTNINNIKIFSMILDDINLYIENKNTILNNSSDNYKANLNDVIDDYRKENNEIVGKAIGREAGLIYASNSNTLTAIGTFINASNLDEESSKAKLTTDTKIENETKRMCENVLLGIKEEIRLLINTIILGIGTELNDDFEYITNIILDMYNFSSKKEGPEYLEEYPYVYENYIYLIDYLNEEDYSEFIRLIKYFNLEDKVAAKIKKEFENKLEEKLEKLLKTNHSIEPNDIEYTELNLYKSISQDENTTSELVFNYISKMIKKDTFDKTNKKYEKYVLLIEQIIKIITKEDRMKLIEILNEKR